MVYDFSFDDFYVQIVEKDNLFKGLLYRREENKLKLKARTYARDFFNTISLLDLFVELKEALE